jgi:SAM-dependent methyltransferase
MLEFDWMTDTRTSYDTVAATYADMFRDLDDRPVMRHLFALFAELVTKAGGGPVADVGCGAGRVTACLRDLGLDVFGIDLSPGMIAIAERDYPGIRFEVGSMTDLDLADASVTGLIAWFSTIHVPDEELRKALHDFHRFLRPDGVLLLGFHVGDGTNVKTEGYGGHPMRVHVHKRPVERVAEWLEEAGFRVELSMHHRPDETVTGGMLLARH